MHRQHTYIQYEGAKQSLSRDERGEQHALIHVQDEGEGVVDLRALTWTGSDRQLSLHRPPTVELQEKPDAEGRREVHAPAVSSARR